MPSGKYFNTEGLCRPGLHYMADTSAKIDAIVCDYIERGRYFVINRARQYGKTTTLELLNEKLSDRYLVLSLSFEGREEYFQSFKALVTGVSSQIQQRLREIQPALSAVFELAIVDQIPMDVLDSRITQLCVESDKPVVLMIDEVDRASDYIVFASLLGILRTKYLKRKTLENRTTFHSVILAGVHDIKNLKARIRQDSEHSYNSPWNIAADFS
ncbi:MAG: AAA-like domain-containing protein, partial [Oscillospiraceae bacterium]|nr:AAA-like domain-containing protein [Oscillospiraceae bacterium]